MRVLVNGMCSIYKCPRCESILEVGSQELVYLKSGNLDCPVCRQRLPRDLKKFISAIK